MPHFFAGEVKFPIRQSCGENTKIGLRRVRRQLDGEKAIYIENYKSNACFLGVVHILRNHFWGSRETPPLLCNIVIIWAYPHPNVIL